VRNESLMTDQANGWTQARVMSLACQLSFLVCIIRLGSYVHICRVLAGLRTVARRP